MEKGKTKQNKSKNDAITYTEIEKKNAYFEFYYKHMYKPYWTNNEIDYNKFFEILKTSLPSSFRVNSNIPYY